MTSLLVIIRIVLRHPFFLRISSRVYNISVAAEAITRARAFDPQRKLIIFVHGFIDDPTKDSFKNISEAFLRSGEFLNSSCGILRVNYLEW